MWTGTRPPTLWARTTCRSGTGGPNTFSTRRRASCAAGAQRTVAEGWLPAASLIGRDTRARRGQLLREKFHLAAGGTRVQLLVPRLPIQCPAALQRRFRKSCRRCAAFRWAFGELDPASLLWIEKNRYLIAATEEGKRAVRETLEHRRAHHHVGVVRDLVRQGFGRALVAGTYRRRVRSASQRSVSNRLRGRSNGSKSSTAYAYPAFRG